MYHRPILKWPGGKFRLLDKIINLLPKRKQLIEPFVGSGCVFLNTDYEAYRLSDSNPDLIGLYESVKTQGQAFTDYAKRLFTSKHNHPNVYYDMRDKFNHTQDPIERASLFLYLNRHGFNGLCRYNKRGFYNVPFGQYKQPYFPEAEMQFFEKKASRATFHCTDFTHALHNLSSDTVVYADPPYVPLNSTSSFTQYVGNGFDLSQQKLLAEKVQKLAEGGVAVLLSNHDTPFTREVYAGARLSSFKVRRNISAQSKGRKHVKELLALFEPSA